MKYYEHLYIGAGITKNKEKILRKLEKNRPILNLYVIVLAHQEQNHLEIFDSTLLVQKIFKKEEQFVVGIADGQEEAFMLVEQITQEVYEKTGGTDICKYLLAENRN